MAFYDRAWMSVASTGTGPVTLGTAVVGFRTFAAAGVADGATVSYIIIDGTTWETGHGTYGAAGSTLSRSPVATSAGNTNPVAISASATVYLDVIASDLTNLASTSGGVFSGPCVFQGGVSVGSDPSNLRTFNITGNSPSPFAVSLGLQNNAATADDSHGVAIVASNTGNAFRNYVAYAGSSHRFLVTDIERVRMDGAAIRPAVDGGQTSGSAAYRWSNVYGINATFTGGTIASVNLGAGHAITGSIQTTYSLLAGVSGSGTMIDANGPGKAVGVYGTATVGGPNPAATLGQSYGGYFINTAPSAAQLNVGVAAFSANGPSIVAGTAPGAYTFLVNANGSVTPGNDNTQTLGSAAQRWSVVFAGTTTINTSDGTLKTVRSGDISDAERAWAKAIKVVAYQFNDAIAEKGIAAARIHWGVIAQDVYAAGKAAGIADPLAYAFLCQDALTQIETKQIATQVPVMETHTDTQEQIDIEDGRAIRRMVPITAERAVIDQMPVFDEVGAPVMRLVTPAFDGIAAIDEQRADDGGIIQPAVAAVPPRAAVYEQATHGVTRTIAGTIEVTEEVPVIDEGGAPVMRWGVRYTELCMFLIACSSI